MPITPAGDYLYYRDLTDANATALGSFVCRLDLSASNFDFTKVRSDGADLAVYDVTASALVPYWLEDFDPIARKARIYFKATLSSNGHRLYYGNPAGTSASNFAAVFSKGTGFDAGWGDLTTATTGPHPQAIQIAAGGDWSTPRGRQLWRRTRTPQIPGTSFGTDLGARDLSITTDRFAQIVEDTPGTWVAYYGSTPLQDGTHWRKTVRTTSTDRGMTWSTPTLILSPDQPYDEFGSMTGTVIKVAPNSYYMWFTATGSNADPAHTGGIGLAKSTDNLNWTKQGIQILATTPAIVDYAAASVSVPDVRVMADGKWVMTCECRELNGPWHLQQWTATSPDGPWTIANSGHPILATQPGVWWAADGSANPHMDELDGGGYVLFTEGEIAHPNITDWNFQPGFLTASTYGGPFIPDATSPIAGRQQPQWGVETGGLSVDAITRERIVFIQDYYLEDVNSPYSNLHRIWPIADRGGLIATNALADGAVAGMPLASGTFTAESRSWMTTHRSEDAAIYVLALVDSATLPAPDTSTNVLAAGYQRLEIRRMSYANANPGDIQFRYWDATHTARFLPGGGTTAVSVASTDTNRDILAAISDDGTDFLLSVVYADDLTPIASATLAKSTVQPFAVGRFLVAGELFTSSGAGGTFFRHIGVRPYAAVEPAISVGAEFPLTTAPGIRTGVRLLESGASRLLEGGAFRFVEGGSLTVLPSSGRRLLEGGASRLLEGGAYRLLENGGIVIPSVGRRLLEGGAFRLLEGGAFRLLEADGGVIVPIPAGVSVATYVQRGCSIDYTPASDLDGGDVVDMATFVGITRRRIKAGELGALAVDGVFAIDKPDGEAIAFGLKVYWDDASKVATAVNTGSLTPLGLCVRAALAGDYKVRVKILAG